MEEIINTLSLYWYFFVAGLIFLILTIWGIVELIKGKQASQEDMTKTKKEKIESRNDDAIQPAKENNVEKTTKLLQDNTTEVVQAKNQDEYEYIISYDADARLWTVKKSNAKKASKRFTTKQEALEYAKGLASKNDKKIVANKKYID